MEHVNNIKSKKALLSNMLSGSAFKKGIVSTFLYTILLNFIAFLSSFIIAKYLGPQGRGEIGLIFIYTQMAMWLAGLGISRGHIYYLNNENDKNLVQKIFTQSVVFSFLTGMAISIILILVIGNMLKGSENLVIKLSKIYAGSIPLIMVGDQIMNILLGLRRYLLFNIQKAVLPVSYALGTIILFLCNRLTVPNLLLVQIFNVFIYLMISIVILNHGYKLRFIYDYKLFKRSFFFGLKSYPNDLSETANQNIDQLLVAPWVGVYNFGLYTVARSFSAILNIFSSSVYSLIFPEVSNRGSLNGKILIKKVLLYSAPVFLIGYLILLFVIPEVIRLLLGTKYIESIILSKLLLLGFVFLGLSQIIQYGFYGLGRQLEAAIINWVSLITCVVLLILLIPIYSLKGAAYAFIGGCFLKFIMYAYRVVRE